MTSANLWRDTVWGVFETERLRLEPLRESHAGELFDLLSDPLLYEFIPQDPPATRDALAVRYRFLESRHSPSGDEAWLNWAVRSKEGGACVGTVQVTVASDRRAQLAYEIGVPFWRRGLATEACARVIRALFEEGIVEVRAELDTRNVASIRLLERLGFTRGGLRRNADRFKGADSDEWTYTLRSPARRPPVS
jgi:RimJ/RimL family protein N-acetyltransferase